MANFFYSFGFLFLFFSSLSSGAQIGLQPRRYPGILSKPKPNVSTKLKSLHFYRPLNYKKNNSVPGFDVTKTFAFKEELVRCEINSEEYSLAEYIQYEFKNDVDDCWDAPFHYHCSHGPFGGSRYYPWSSGGQQTKKEPETHYLMSGQFLLYNYAPNGAQSGSVAEFKNLFDVKSNSRGIKSLSLSAICEKAQDSIHCYEDENLMLSFTSTLDGKYFEMSYYGEKGELAHQIYFEKKDCDTSPGKDYCPECKTKNKVKLLSIPKQLEYCQSSPMVKVVKKDLYHNFGNVNPFEIQILMKNQSERCPSKIYTYLNTNFNPYYFMSAGETTEKVDAENFEQSAVLDLDQDGLFERLDFELSAEGNLELILSK